LRRTIINEDGRKRSLSWRDCSSKDFKRVTHRQWKSDGMEIWEMWSNLTQFLIFISNLRSSDSIQLTSQISEARLTTLSIIHTPTFSRVYNCWVTESSHNSPLFGIRFISLTKWNDSWTSIGNFVSLPVFSCNLNFCTQSLNTPSSWHWMTIQDRR
jgi:hypothetical protein